MAMARPCTLGPGICGVQRNYQKVVEEAPAPFIDPAELDAISASSANVAAEIGYAGVGTFEFLYQDGRFYFIEMNTRLQVEHPVTEAITGIDLVAARLPCGGHRHACRAIRRTSRLPGHAVECRLNAEAMDETGRLTPSPGTIDRLLWPGGPGIRVDSHLYPGYRIPHYYDSLVGKLIAAGPSRELARARMEVALGETEIHGIETNRELLQAIVAAEGFAAGELGEGLIRDARAGN
ncbi:MAG: hypothetical protein U5O39_08675 [Gammaproteobacteria bacterium]|nr:hypothetical protein [Gammaproteobacteria bacterium]